MDEMTAETNVEAFDEVGVDAGPDGAEEQATQPAEETAGETTNEATGNSVNDATEQETEPNESEKPFVKRGNDENRDRRIAQRERWRREREEAERQAYRKGILDSVGGVNPYTNQKIEDNADVEEFLAMREIERSGGDPISDYASYMKKKTREQAQKTAEEAKAQQEQEWFQRDYKEFLESHPELDFAALQRDESFQLFAEGKIGRQSLSKIYENFLKVAGKYEAKAEKTAQKMYAKAKASPGSLTGGEPQTVSYATMSEQDFDKKLNAVLKGLEKI